MDMTELCAELRNWFPPEKQRHNGEYIHVGHFIISGESIVPTDFLKKNQFFRIVGSDLNDGVFKNAPEELKKLADEEFDGEIWEMSIPQSVIKLTEEIQAWENKYSDTVNSPYTSESFKGYSYSKAVGNGANLGGATGITWRSVFADRLGRWRKI